MKSIAYYPTKAAFPGSNGLASGLLRFVLAGLLVLALLTASGQVWGQNLVCQYPPQTGAGTYSTSACNTYSGLTWPTTWTAITALNDPYNDSASGGTDNDIVGNSNYPAVYTARNGDYLFFRMRVNYADTVTVPYTTPDQPKICIPI